MQLDIHYNRENLFKFGILINYEFELLLDLTPGGRTSYTQ